MLLRNCSRIYVPSQSPPAMVITFLSCDNPITTVEGSGWCWYIHANIKGVWHDGIHGAPYIAAPWILWVQGGAPYLAELVYNSHNYGLWQI